jgi:hypothetical protein
VLLLVLWLGLHWALLQSVAWMGMLVTYSRETSFTEAVGRTFDGEHPCCLCKAIKAAEKSGRKSEAAAPPLKVEFPLAAENVRLFPPTHFVILGTADSGATCFLSKPPVPPPRALRA